MLSAVKLLCLAAVCSAADSTVSGERVMLALIPPAEQANILPQFLGVIDRLTYPKHLLTIWFVYLLTASIMQYPSIQKFSLEVKFANLMKQKRLR